MTINVAFDLDGTLIETSTALKKAYDAVGATWKPNAPWRQWCTPERHELKTTIYPFYLWKYATLLPMMEKVEQFDWQVLTGASEQSVDAIREAFGLRLAYVRCGLCAVGKAKAIRDLDIHLYFDDDQATLDLIKREVPECQLMLSYWQAGAVRAWCR